jgi:antitoxin (DNA-binding transcriptional repressor) of toxin-antitoxin stability system
VFPTLSLLRHLKRPPGLLVTAAADHDQLPTGAHRLPYAVARAQYAPAMARPGDPPTEVSVHQLVADADPVVRGLRQGREYVLTLDGEPIAEITPLPRYRGAKREDVLAAFAGAPVIDVKELRRDLYGPDYGSDDDESGRPERTGP